MQTESSTELEFKVVSFVDVLDQDLIFEYEEECSIPEIGPITPQIEMYAKMEKSGLMHTIGVFSGDELVGFATLLIFVLPHYGKKVANIESLFLAKEHRHGGAGRKLMARIEEFAKWKGCMSILYNARRGSRLERLLTVLPEYMRTNSVFLKSL